MAGQSTKPSQPDLKRKRNEQPKLPFKKQCTGSDTMSTYNNMSGKENFEFFYGNKSPFSQHYPASFTIDGVTFNCAEQYMMYQKAVIFKDKEFEGKIMATSDPVQQKKYGRKVRNFDAEVWKKQSSKVVERANEAKFSQNPDLKTQLLATFPRLLVEASPRDRLWGIGLGRNNPKAWDMKTWRGRNLLGHALTRVRDKLRVEEGGGDAEGGSMKGKEGETIKARDKMHTDRLEDGAKDVQTDKGVDHNGGKKTDSPVVEGADSRCNENVVYAETEGTKAKE